MKKYFVIALVAVIGLYSFTAVASNSGTTSNGASASDASNPISVVVSDPISLIAGDSFVIEQTVELSGGKSVVLYWEKSGDTYSLYSEQNLNKVNVNNITGTSFKKVSAPKGKLYHKVDSFDEGLSQVIDLCKQYKIVKR